MLDTRYLLMFALCTPLLLAPPALAQDQTNFKIEEMNDEADARRVVEERGMQDAGGGEALTDQLDDAALPSDNAGRGVPAGGKRAYFDSPGGTPPGNVGGNAFGNTEGEAFPDDGGQAYTDVPPNR